MELDLIGMGKIDYRKKDNLILVKVNTRIGTYTER